MTGTIRKNHSHPHGSQMYHERVSKRRRVVEIGCDEWVCRPSAGRRVFEHLRRNHHGHKPQPRYRAYRRAESARKRHNIRRERRAYKAEAEDIHNMGDLMVDEEVCFQSRRKKIVDALNSLVNWSERVCWPCADEEQKKKIY